MAVWIATRLGSQATRTTARTSSTRPIRRRRRIGTSYATPRSRTSLPSLPVGRPLHDILLDLQPEPIEDVPLLQVEAGGVDPLLHPVQLRPEGRDVVRRRVPDALQVVLEALGLLVPGEVEVAEGQLALHCRADSVGLLLRSLDRHVGRVRDDLEAVRRQPHRLAPHDGTEQVPRRVPDCAQRPRLAPGGLADVDLVQPDRGQRATHGVHEVVLVGALAHDERDLQELPLLPPALDEQDRRDRDHLEHRYAEHGGGRIADRDHAGARCRRFALHGTGRRSSPPRSAAG